MLKLNWIGFAILTGFVLMLADLMSFSSSPVPVRAAVKYHSGQEGDGSVTTTVGTKIRMSYEPGSRRFYAWVQRGKLMVPAADGTYKLTNGGAIRVKAGEIVWDAFGVVEKVNAGIPGAHPGTDKG